MTKHQYFNLVIEQKNLHTLLGAAFATAVIHDGLRWYAIAGIVIILKTIKSTEKATERFEQALPIKPLAKESTDHY